jgi:hypothetical protein
VEVINRFWRRLGMASFTKRKISRVERKKIFQGARENVREEIVSEFGRI